MYSPVQILACTSTTARTFLQTITDVDAAGNLTPIQRSIVSSISVRISSSESKKDRPSRELMEGEEPVREPIYLHQGMYIRKK